MSYCNSKSKPQPVPKSNLLIKLSRYNKNIQQKQLLIHSNNLFGLQIWHLQDDDDNDKNNPDEDKQSKGQYAKIKKKKRK